VLVAMKEKGLRAECLIDVKRIPGLSGITAGDGRLSIGATTTLHEIEASPLVRQACPALAESVAMIGSLQVRNRGTLGGNLANASPAADSTPALIVSAAELELVSETGARTVPVEDFFVGPGRSVLRPGELLWRISIPTTPEMEPLRHAAYLKFGGREAMDIALVGVAVSLRFDEGGSCTEGRVALASVAPRPLRATGAEAALVGELTDERVRQAAALAADQATPIDDVRGSASYRRNLVQVLTERAIRAAEARYRSTPSA
jgi:carbon-monoxide dehydrogenase medium subunit